MKNIEPHSLVKEFIAIRKEAGISQLGFSKLTGKSRNTLRNWECNGVEPGITAFEKALNAFGYELEIVRKG